MKHRGEALSLDAGPDLGGEKRTRGRGLPKGANYSTVVSSHYKGLTVNTGSNNHNNSLLQAHLCFHVKVVLMQTKLFPSPFF